MAPLDDAACDAPAAKRLCSMAVPCHACVSAGGTTIAPPGLTILDGGMGHQLKA
eukprot:CAMPEP_0197925962 /NCGR_PEP_ID=MMETSP1439-20131203/98380_1 /TAXON_ID=66791 /ORGANISM="Gonyaulax spinifera, Strain CCMP409" /LENGTH=53 /DNA_ID=CAMNT_0043548475 /DNA_START=42 /DNA_END=200 /DNA_ORIENTATION=+